MAPCCDASDVLPCAVLCCALPCRAALRLQAKELVRFLMRMDTPSLMGHAERVASRTRKSEPGGQRAWQRAWLSGK